VGSAAPIAAFMATKAMDDLDLHPQRQRRAGTGVEDGEARLFWFAMERPEDGVPRGAARGWQGPPENSRAQPLPVWTGRRPIALWKAVGRPSS